MVCGVTNARRARSALDSPGSSSTAASTAYCATVAPCSRSAAASAACSAVWLKADEVARLAGALADHGVPVVPPPFDGPFGRTFAFADPDGYVITVHG